VALCGFLTPDAVPGPGDRIEALWLDVLFASETRTVTTIANPAQCFLNIAKQHRFAIEILYCQFAFAREFQFVNCIGRLFDGYIPSILERR
jgi:hypothetical protein